MKLIRTQKSRIRFKDGKIKQSCFLMCQKSNNLANQTLWEIKEHYKETQTMISSIDVEKKIRLDNHNVECLGLPYNDNHRSLLSNCSLQTIKSIYNEYASFFALLQKKKNDSSFEVEIKEPGFKRKGGLFKIIYASKQFGYNKKTHELKLGISGFIKKELSLKGGTYITHKLPHYIKYEDINEARIQPINGGIFYNIEIVYEKEINQIQEVGKNLSPTYLGIDLGVNNLATCINGKNGESFIIDGRKLKSYNRYFNKRIAQLKAQKDQLLVNKWKKTGKDLEGLKKVKKPLTKKEKTTFAKRKNYLDNYMNQSVVKIVKYCKENKLNTIVVGENKEWKQEIDIGKVNNQKFYSIPHDLFKKKLYYKAEENNIKVDFQEEAHTSKCSFIDKEEVGHHDNYLGKRLKRGLFKTQEGKLVNADVNGAANIVGKYILSKLNNTKSNIENDDIENNIEKNLKVSIEFKKSILNLKDTFYKGVCSGFMNNPIRMNVI